MVLGVDVGSSAVKVVAVDAAGRVRRVAERECPLRTSGPDRAEHDPAEVLAAAIAAISDCAQGVHVAALAFSAALHTLLGLDAAGQPRTPSLSWADTRATAAAARLRESVPWLHQETGTPLHPMSPLAKLVHLREHDPELHADIARWSALKDHLLHHLTGRLVTDHSSASGSGLLRLATLDWHDGALQLAGVTAAQLPDLVEPLEVLSLSAAGAAATGLPAGLPVIAGAGDGPLANLGVGAVSPGEAAVSLGTSGALRVVRDAPAVDPDARTFCYLLAEGLWVLGGAVSNAGVVVDWAAEAFSEPDGPGDVAALLAEAETVPPGAGALLALPVLLGERAPYWDPVPRGALLGLRREHGRAEVVRALVEGVCLRLALVRDAVQTAGGEVASVLATGGSLRSPVWASSLGAALGMPVHRAEAQGGSGLGAALLGWCALGELRSLPAAAELLPVGERVEPDPLAVQRLAALRPLADAAHRALAETSTALAGLAAEWERPSE